jgi:hypothetical protein
MADEEGPPVITGDKPDTAVVQIGRFELRGASATRLLKLVIYTAVALIVATPGAMAFFAYAKGGTSLWAAIAFAVAVPGGIGWWWFRKERR